MGGTSFSLDWGGLETLLERGVQQIHQTQELAESIGEALASTTQQRFEDQEAPSGASWAPSKAAAQRGGQTLVDKGELRNSIGYEASPQMIVVGSNKVYARIHQLGGKAGRGHNVTLPARAYLGWSEEDQEEVREMLRQHIATAFIG